MNQQHYSEYEEQKEQERRQYEEKHRRQYEEKQRREEKKVSIPPMRYKLTKLTQAQTLTQIAMKTQGFYSMSTRSADWVQRDVRNREFSSYGSYPAPRDRSITHTIIGEDNYYLKLTMKNHDMDYICYDGDKNEFQFWGEYQCCIRAMNELRYRIEKVKNRMEKDGHRTQLQEQWPVSNCHDYDRDNNTDNNYCPPSPTFDFDIYYDNMYSSSVLDNANSTTANPPADISYSKVAVNQMQKMGFVEGSGLGSKNSGRLNPLNPVDDLGGRSYNHHHGLGFTEQASSEEQLTEPVIHLTNALAEAVVVVPSSDNCGCFGDKGGCCMSCWRNMDA